MFALTRFKNINGPARIVPEALDVTPELLGLPLAAPTRRLLAMALDAIFIALLSGFDSAWALAGVALIALRLREGHSTFSTRRNCILALAMVLLLVVALAQMLAPASPKADAANAGVSFQLESDPDTASAESTEMSTPKKDLDRTAQQNARIARLEHELELAHRSLAKTWLDDLAGTARAYGLGFGWAVAYFTLIPFWWGGQTPGKRLLRLRVVELTGKPMTLLHCFSRYGGYAAGMATGGFGFAQVLWDINRQAIQDRIAHTVVIDEKQSGAGGKAHSRASTLPAAATPPQ